MAEGPLGGPRPFVGDEVTLTVVVSGTMQRPGKVVDSVVRQVAAEEGLSPTDSSHTFQEGNTLVDVTLKGAGISLSELRQIETNVEATLKATDVNASRVLEVVVR